MESLAGIKWNGWPEWNGIAGRNHLEYSIASCDTTSWARSGSIGKINYFNLETGKCEMIYTGGIERKLKTSEHHFVTYPWRKDVEDYLYKNFKLTYRDLCGYKAKLNMQVINTRFFVEKEKRINAERIQRGVPLE